MKNKLTVLGLALALAGIVTGCGTTGKTLTPALVQIAVQTGTSYGIMKDTNAIPYLRAAAPVICNAAGSGTLDPTAVVAALESSGSAQLKTPEGVIIINGVLAIYEAVYDAYGTNVQASVVQPYLQAVCNGLNGALGTTRNAPPKYLLRCVK
jgi:hypothetical protein